LAGRRLVALALTLWAPAVSAWALSPEMEPAVRLDALRSAIVRAWIVRIVNEQLRQGPTPRWFHRDCAGLVRFAVGEALRRHDARWLVANGLSGEALPPELELTEAERRALIGWMRDDGTRGAFVTAQTLVRLNSRLVARDVNVAEPGDLLFFDQGDNQHLMVWMGRYVAYHTGAETPSDNGLRAVTHDQLMRWKDTRWRPESGNPNFVGVFRLSFLSR
jgi:uncharacterized protein YfaT (DUF1175 family)